MASTETPANKNIMSHQNWRGTLLTVGKKILSAKGSNCALSQKSALNPSVELNNRKEIQEKIRGD